MHALFTHKPLLSFIIFVWSLAGGLLPASLDLEQQPRLLAALNAFSRGLFLGLGIVHFFPDALASISTHHTPGFVSQFLSRYAALLCATGITLIILALVATEQRLQATLARTRQQCLAYLVLFMLSLHSLLAGLALGMEASLAGIMILFIAIMSHKSFAALGLGVKLRVNQLSQTRTIWLIVLFSLMTPVGIYLGLVMQALPASHISHVADALLHTFLAGLFIYLALFDDNQNAFATPIQALSFSAGFIATAVISVVATLH